MIELLGTYTTENASQAREDAHRCIIASLADPTTYIMDHLLTPKVMYWEVLCGFGFVIVLGILYIFIYFFMGQRKL